MKKKLSLATWNVRTLLDLKDAERPQKQTALDAQELLHYTNYTFFWIGKKPWIRREAGVWFAITNKLVKQLPMLPTGISERLINLRISIGKTRYATIISAYAPTMTNPDQTKEKFYELLAQTLQKIPPTDKVIILGDFTARVGDDFTSWPIALGNVEETSQTQMVNNCFLFAHSST